MAGLEQAEELRAARKWHLLLGVARAALERDDEDVRAHAWLALALVHLRRTRAARTEVDKALGLDGANPLAHHAAAALQLARGELADAWAHCQVALQAAPDTATRVLAAAIRTRQGDRDAARELLDDALAHDLRAVAAMAALAELACAAGDLASAQKRIARALELDPADGHVRVVAGRIALAAGDPVEAERHARYVLSGPDAGDRDALALWIAIKVHRNAAVGAWWRTNAYLASTLERRKVGVLIGAFVLVRLAILIAAVFGHEDAESILRIAWLGFCVYTWFAPSVFRWMLAREL